MQIKRLTIFLAVLFLALVASISVRAQDNTVPPSADVIQAVIQDASRLSGQQLTLDNVHWQFVTFKTTALDCSGGSQRVLPAQLYGYDLTVSRNDLNLDYRARALADRLFQCTANGPGPDIKIIHDPANLLAVPGAPIPPNVAERGTPPPLENGPTVRHDIQRFGRGTLDSAAYRSDGKVLAVGGSLGIWLLADDLSPIAHLGGSNLKVTSLAWRPDGKQLATTEYENAVQLWDIDTGNARTLEHIPLTKGAIDYHGSVSYSPDGSRLASASPDRTVKIWDTTTGKLLNAIHVDGDVHAVAWNPDGKRLAVGGAFPAATEDERDKPLSLVYDVTTGKLLASLKPEDHGDGSYTPGAPILEMRWFRDGKQLFLISSAQSSYKPVGWNTDTGEVAQYDIFISCGVILTGVFVSPDVSHYAAALESCESSAAGAGVYGTDSFGMGRILSVNAGYGAIRTIAWSPDGIHLAVVRSTSGVALHDITQVDNTEIFLPVQRQFEGIGRVTDPNDQRVAAEAMGFGMMDREWQVIDPSIYGYPIFSPDGKMAVAYDPHLKQPVILDANTGDRLAALEIPSTMKQGDSFMYSAYSWSGDDTFLIGNPSATNTTMWDARTGKMMLTLDKGISCGFGLEKSQLLCAPTPRSTTDAVTITVVDAATGKPLHKLIDKFDGYIHDDPQGHCLVLVGNDRHVRIWNRTLDKQLQDIPGIHIQWTPDNSRLLIFAEDGTATLYDPAADRVVTVLHGTDGPLDWIHAGQTFSVAFSPDGTRFVTVDLSGEMDIWDSHTGQKLLRLIGHRGPLMSLPTWSDDGRQITSRGSDGTVRVWSVS